jgi:hyaluronan synthase
MSSRSTVVYTKPMKGASQIRSGTSDEPDLKRPAPAITERRRHHRVSDPFPATIVPLHGLFGGNAIRGLTKDYDEAGACIQCSQPLEVGAQVRIRLHLPRSISEFFRGLPCELSGRVGAARKRKSGDETHHEIVIVWEKPLPETVRSAISAYQRKIGTLVFAVLAFIIWFKWETADSFWYQPLFFVYSTTLLTYLISRFFISWRHQPPELANYTPSLSMIISVRNEEQAIAHTVDACYQSDYPADKRELIVVDDGSTDGTRQVLGELVKKYPDLRVYSLPPSGKRFAMAEGVRKAQGEILVFIDSDTFLFRDALKHIVCGFEDPTLGASAGYTAVENADVNVLTGLQEVRYFVSYRLLKSSESVFNSVTCCPGCLSAYRKSYVMEILEPWLHQTFLGAPATFGDDRSLTNFILRKYRVIYNDAALASTLVPETWGHYLRQQLRWKKSWLRETMIACRFMYKKHPVAAISFYATSLFSILSPAMLARVIYLGYKGQDSIFLYYLLGLILVGFLQSLYFLYKRPSPHWILGMLWMASSMVLTGPQTYYAILTMRKNHWGTR